MEAITITCNQKFSRKGLGYLWKNKDKLDPGQVAIITSIYNNKKKCQLQGEQTITYKLSNKKEGKLGFGRFYGSKGSLETLEKECRGTLCNEFYYDLDIVNCHPVLLVQFASFKYNKDLPELIYYVNNREAILKLISPNRDEAKTEMIRILYGGKNKYAVTESLSREIHAFSKFVANQTEYSGLYEECKKKDNIYGSLLSFVIQSEEVKCMMAMKKYFESKKITIGVLAYDGLMIEKSNSYILDDALIKGVEDAIEKETKYSVNVIEKKMSFYDVPEVAEEIVPGVSKEDYTIMKEKFELTHFYFYQTNEYAEITNNDIYLYTEGHARRKFSKEYIFKLSDKHGDYEEFFPLWLKDDSRRFIRKISFSPSDDPEVYTQNIDFAFKSAKSQPNEEVLSLFNTLININSNNNDILKDYLLKYLAHMLQKPLENPNVGLIITGDKGVGKDTLIDLLGEYVMGYKCFQNYQSNAQFFDKYDINRKYKFLVKLEEADRKYFLEDASLLKSLITAKINTFNPKGQMAFECENHIRYIFTTNKANIAEMNGGERRFVIMSCSAERKGDFDFWDKVYATLYTPEAGRIIAEYLMNYDITNYNPRRLPKNELQDNIIESEKNEMDLFLEQWDGLELKSSELYEMYRTFCINSNLLFANNSISFGKKLIPYIAKNKLKKRNVGGYPSYSKCQ